MKKPMIRIERIRELLFDNEAYIREFAVAAVKSFAEFRTRYASSLRKGEEQPLRNAGHKIKPSAQMLELQELLDEYETGKELLDREASPEERDKSAVRMEEICDRIIREMEALA